MDDPSRGGTVQRPSNAELFDRLDERELARGRRSYLLRRGVRDGLIGAALNTAVLSMLGIFPPARAGLGGLFVRFSLIALIYLPVQLHLASRRWKKLNRPSIGTWRRRLQREELGE